MDEPPGKDLERGLCPSPEFFLDFWARKVEFWCILWLIEPTFDRPDAFGQQPSTGVGGGIALPPPVDPPRYPTYSISSLLLALSAVALNTFKQKMDTIYQFLRATTNIICGVCAILVHDTSANTYLLYQNIMTLLLLPRKWKLSRRMNAQQPDTPLHSLVPQYSF